MNAKDVRTVHQGQDIKEGKQQREEISLVRTQNFGLFLPHPLVRMQNLIIILQNLHNLPYFVCFLLPHLMRTYLMDVLILRKSLVP